MFLAQSWQSYGIFILETLVALSVVALAAWAAVYFGRTRFGKGGKSGRMRIVERLVLEPRRSIYLIEVDGQTLLVSSAEGSVRVLKDLSTIDDSAAKGGPNK